MGGETKIQWTDATWNPVSGCSHVSEGCRNCYAESFARRFQKDFKPWTTPNAAHNVRLHPERFEQPLRWKKPRRVFVNSVSDLFHPNVPSVFIAKVFGAMQTASQHVFQVLTKRPERMRTWIEWFSTQWLDRGAYPAQYGHVWLGVSAEDQPTFDERVPLLLQTLAAKRFVSLEPMLGPINARRIRLTPPKRPEGAIRPIADWDEIDPLEHTAINELGIQYRIKSGIDWVVAGCESGPNRRNADIEWFRSIRDQCVSAATPFFLKQIYLAGKKISLPLLDGKKWDQIPGQKT